MENQIELNGIVFRRCVSHCPDVYVSENGGIYHGKFKRIIDVPIHRIGYYKYICFHDLKGTIRTFQIHRLVAIYWIKNERPGIAKEVNHINLNRFDNRVCNLEWVTQAENSAHYYANRRRHPLDIFIDPWDYKTCVKKMQKRIGIDELLGIGIEEGEKK